MFLQIASSSRHCCGTLENRTPEMFFVNHTVFSHYWLETNTLIFLVYLNPLVPKFSKQLFFDSVCIKSESLF